MTYIVTLNFNDNEHDIVIFEKTPKCCIKNCDDYGSKGMCSLKMCDKHFNMARD